MTNFNSISFQVNVIPSSKYCGLSVYTTSHVENKLQRSRKKCIHFGKFSEEGGIEKLIQWRRWIYKEQMPSKCRNFEEIEKQQIMGGNGYLNVLKLGK